MGHRSKTKSIKAKTPSSSKRVPAHHVAKSYHVPESATEIPKDSVNRRIVFRFDCDGPPLGNTPDHHIVVVYKMVPFSNTGGKVGEQPGPGRNRG